MSKHDELIADGFPFFFWSGFRLALRHIRAAIEADLIPKIESDGYPGNNKIPRAQAFDDPVQAKRQVDYAVRNAEWAAYWAQKCKKDYAKHQGHRYRGRARIVRVTVRSSKPRSAQ
jgi:hypothetical protein